MFKHPHQRIKTYTAVGMATGAIAAFLLWGNALLQNNDLNLVTSLKSGKLALFCEGAQVKAEKIEYYAAGVFYIDGQEFTQCRVYGVEK